MVSADGVKDYDKNKAQDVINAEVDTALSYKYQKPVGGIPKGDLAEGVQASLNKADSALQSQAQADWNESDSTKASFIKNKPTIPDVSNLYTKTEGQALESEVDDRLDAQDAAIALLNGSDVVVVADHTLVDDPDTQKIYREYGSDSYTDYMCVDATTTPVAWQPLATYSYPGVDNVPTENSEKLVKSGGVREALDELGYYTQSEKWVKVITDKDGKIIAGIKSDGSVEWAKGIPAPIQYVLDDKVDKVEGKGLVDTDFADSFTSVDHPYYVVAVADKDNKVLYGVDNKGVFHAGEIESPTITALKSKIYADTRPPYYTDAWMDNVVDDIQNQVGVENGFSFVFVTDLHFGDYNQGTSKYLIKEILDRTTVPFAICGGDIPYAYGTEEELEDDIKEFLEYRRVIGADRFFAIRGNHDFGITDASGPENVNYKKSLGYVNGLLGINNGWNFKALPSHMCYVIENKSEKSRILLLNSQDKQGSSTWGADSYVSAAQIRWLLEDVFVDDGYKYVVISHIPADSAISDYSSTQDVLHNLLLAVKNKTSFTCTIEDQTLSKDFTVTNNDVICHISGHNHRDMSHVDNNLLSITSEADVALRYAWNQYRNFGTVTECAFDVFTVDFDSNKLKAYRVGGGESRQWNI